MHLGFWQNEGKKNLFNGVLYNNYELHMTLLSIQALLGQRENTQARAMII